jgi:hypothetical protein
MRNGYYVILFMGHVIRGIARLIIQLMPGPPSFRLAAYQQLKLFPVYVLDK